MNKLAINWQNFTQVGLPTQVCFKNMAVRLSNFNWVELLWILTFAIFFTYHTLN